ncbi:MAG: AMP-binding protein, partial [Vicinamibacteria bacterium]
HHFLHDGWSYGVFLEELSACYRAFSRGALPALAPPALQYRELTVRERERFDRGDLRSELEYWKETLAFAPPPPSLPSDRPRAKTPSFRGRQIRRVLDPPAYARLLAASAREGVTPFTWLHTVFQVFLHRYTGATDLVVGCGFANRGASEAERTLGMVINTVAIRGDLSGAPSFRELLRRRTRRLLEAADHQSAPFEAVVRALDPERPQGPGQVLFNTFFDSYDRPYPELRAPGVEVTREDGVGNGQVKFDLVVLVVPRTASENRVVSANLLWEYSSDLFEESTAARMLSHFQSLLEASLESPEIAIGRLPMCSPEEKERAVSFGASARASYPRDVSISGLFEEQAALRAQAIAVTAGEDAFTYDELNRRANQLARDLRSQGVGPEVVVGVAIGRSVDLVVALLAILKAGGAYLPLDLDSPRERRDRTLAEAGARLVLTSVPLDAEWGSENLDGVAGGDALAYVMYTSGSTGAPKGVAVPHRGVVRLVKNPNYVELGPEETVLQLAPISFDASTFEIWGALLNGGTLALFPPKTPTLQDLGRFLEERKVTTLWLTAPLFH